jgi:hypothetical protein
MTQYFVSVALRALQGFAVILTHFASLVHEILAREGVRIRFNGLGGTRWTSSLSKLLRILRILSGGATAMTDAKTISLCAATTRGRPPKESASRLLLKLEQ